MRLRILVVLAIAAAVSAAMRCGGAIDESNDASSVQVLMDGISPTEIAVCGGYLYWIGTTCDGGVPSGAGDLNRVPLDGGANEIVVPNVGVSLACNENTLYFWRDSATLSALPLDAGAPGAPYLVADAPDQGLLLTSDASVFWVDPQRGIYTAVDGAAVPVASAPGSNGGVAGNDHVYWSADEFASSDGGLLDGGLLSVPFDGGAPNLLWSGQSLSREAVTPSHVYWVQYYSPTLMQLELDSGIVAALPTDASPIQESPLVTDGQHLYWLASSAETHRIDLDGQNDTVVLTLAGTDYHAIEELALHDGWLYASLLTHPLGLPCGGIVKVAK